MSDADLEAVAHGTGVRATIIGGLAVVAAWVSMGIGLSLAEDRMTPKGDGVLAPGKESYLVAGDAFFWASAFAALALISFIVAVVRGRKSRRNFSYMGGILGLGLVLWLTVVIIVNTVEISTWV